MHKREEWENYPKFRRVIAEYAYCDHVAKLATKKWGVEIVHAIPVDIAEDYSFFCSGFNPKGLSSE